MITEIRKVGFMIGVIKNMRVIYVKGGLHCEFESISSIAI
jgi:hypothetical protein